LAARTHAAAAARHAYLEGEYAFAREAALRAAEAFELAGDPRAALKARFVGITCLTRIGSFTQGEAEVEVLRPIVAASDDDVLRCEFHLIASAALGETRREAALEDARRSLALALRIGDRYGEARARHNVAVIAGKLRLYEEALDGHERALAAYRDVGDAPGVRDTLLNIAGVRIWCGDYERPQQLLDEVGVEEEATPWLALRCQFIRGALAERTERTADAERYLIDAHRRAEELGTALYRARSEFELAKLLASHGRPDAAAGYVRSALETYATMGQPDLEIEALALGARLLASLGDASGACERAERAAARCKEKRLQSYSEIAWNLAAAYALIGDEPAAQAYARDAAAAAVDDALRMPADLAETYLQLPWHQQTVAYLSGRAVPLRFE
jgi:tetratricopeptide (TPR) repeat protein